jgi:hypothetical protein
MSHPDRKKRRDRQRENKRLGKTNDKFNTSHCRDLTAFAALNNVSRKK